MKESNGFVYVDLDNDYIHKLISFIREDGFEEPPYFEREDLVGAHITVAYPNEIEKYKVHEMEEFGEIIPFTLKRCKVVHPPFWEGVDQVYFIEVEAPELHRIRKKYGLPKSLYEFHITVGIKPEAKIERN